MKININIGWLITIIVLGIVAGWFANFFAVRMKNQNKTYAAPANGNMAAVPITEAPAVAA